MRYQIIHVQRFRSESLFVEKKRDQETMKDHRAMFKSMDTEIMQISILVDEMLERLGSEAIIEAASPFLHFVPMGEIERFQRTLLKFRDTLDAETSVEWWIIDDLGLGKVEGLIFEDEQLPRSETSGVLTWWRQMRAALEIVNDLIDEISNNTSISKNEGFHIFTIRHIQRQRLFSDYSMDTIFGVMTEMWKRLNDTIMLKPPDPKRSETRTVSIFDDVVGQPDDVNQIAGLMLSNIAKRCATITVSPDIHLMDTIFGVITRVWKRSNDSVTLKSPDPKRIDAPKRLHDIVGRQEDLNRIVELLCEATSASPDVHVIPVLGDSGLGKTALAKLVYSDHRVKRHFDKKIWVSFSNGYVNILESTMSLLLSSTIGEEMPKDIIDGVPLNLDHRLKSLLQGSLDGKKFLIVLDGVPNQICYDWDSLKIPLMTGKTGSRILVTTRSSRVSSALGTVPPHNLRPLSFEDSWLLFTSMTSSRPLQCYQEMVKWFQGFPSLVIALSEFSHSKPNVKEIEAAVAEVVAEVKRDHNAYSRISPALLRTYHSLSSLHVKQCFLYCGLFPKDYTFKKHKLVYLWMAEGFLQSKGRTTMEQVGFSYFEELLQACFIKCKYVDFIHHDSSLYIISDLTQYLLQYMCGKEYLRIDNDEICFSEYTRHLLLCWKGVSGHSFDIPPQSSSLQTLFLLGELGSDNRSRFEKHIEKLTHDIPNFTRLRVLDISYTSLSAVPDSICNLKHLRYLDISGCNLKCLPEKIIFLHNLQTLIIGGPNKVPLFPRGMGNLVSLRHLILGCRDSSFVMPPGVGKLTNLQTLPTFVVGRESGEYGSIEELKELKYLEGSLSLMKLENVSQEKAAQGSWLVDKEGLQKLEFVWNVFVWDMHAIAENLLLSLKPHTNLKHLKLVNYGGRKFPTWMACPSFSNLETIELYFCKNVEYLPPLGQLPSLKSLCIIVMDEIKYIDNRFLGNHMDGVKKGFESLKFLKIAELKCLEKWTGLSEGDMPNLEELEISWCDTLISLPSLKLLRSLKRLTLSSCFKLDLPSEELPKSLDSLFIWCCPFVSKGCSEEGEEAGDFDDKVGS